MSEFSFIVVRDAFDCEIKGVFEEIVSRNVVARGLRKCSLNGICELGGLHDAGVLRWMFQVSRPDSLADRCKNFKKMRVIVELLLDRDGVACIFPLLPRRKRGGSNHIKS